MISSSFYRLRRVVSRRGVLGDALLRRWNSSTVPSLRIVFGSQSGTAEAFANELEFDAQEHNISTELVDALQFRIDDLVSKDSSKPTLTAFVVACYGEGEPTDNAKKFFESLHSVPATDTTKLSGSKYAVFGLGNSQCFRDRYNVVGKLLDKRLGEIGGERIVPLGLGDASPEAIGDQSMGSCWLEWKQKVLDAARNLPATAATSTTTENKPASNTAPRSLKENVQVVGDTKISTSNSVSPPSGLVPIALSARQKAMVPSNRTILLSTVSHVTQLFTKTDELTAVVEVEFDLTKTRPFIGNESLPASNESFTQGLQPGDHIGIFAPNSQQVVDRFALAAGLTSEELDQPIASTTTSNKREESQYTLRQILTWQTHLSGPASITSVKLLQRWLKDQPRLPRTTELFQELERNYESLVKEKGLDTAAILEMIPKLPGPNGHPTVSLPIQGLLKTLPTLNPRLYSITHMVLPADRQAATTAAKLCPITKQLVLSDPAHSSPTAADDYTKITLLCRLLRYRQTSQSFGSRIIDGVCSSYLSERLQPQSSVVALFFRESNFHLPKPLPKESSEAPSPVIMIGGGSGIAPFMSFLEERQRILTNPQLKIGSAVLYFGCRSNEEYIFREKLVSYLSSPATATPASSSSDDTTTLNRLVIGFSKQTETGTVSSQTQSVHPHEILYPQAAHIPSVVLTDKDYLLPLIRQGGVVYVCGGAGQFGKAIREVVNTIAMEALGIRSETVPEGTVHPGIRRLIQEKRYFEDLAD